jgi:hypothetical protein
VAAVRQMAGASGQDVSIRYRHGRPSYPPEASVQESGGKKRTDGPKTDSPEHLTTYATTRCRAPTRILSCY